MLEYLIFLNYIPVLNIRLTDKICKFVRNVRYYLDIVILLLLDYIILDII